MWLIVRLKDLYMDTYKLGNGIQKSLSTSEMKATY